MKQKLLTFFIGVITCVAAGLFLGTFVQAGFYSSEEDVTVEEPSTAAVPPGPTARLIIPSIGVNAKVQNVGRAKSGSMAVPTNYSDVGWYRHGPFPGEVGSAVMDGHVDNGFGLDAVFKDLHTLEPGDDVYVETKEGNRLRFVVTAVETYDAEDVPTNMLFGRSDTARLNLITCSGEYDRSSKTYDKRTVVYTVLK